MAGRFVRDRFSRSAHLQQIYNDAISFLLIRDSAFRHISKAERHKFETRFANAIVRESHGRGDAMLPHSRLVEIAKTAKDLVAGKADIVTVSEIIVKWTDAEILAFGRFCREIKSYKQNRLSDPTAPIPSIGESVRAYEIESATGRFQHTRKTIEAVIGPQNNNVTYLTKPENVQALAAKGIPITPEYLRILSEIESRGNPDPPTIIIEHIKRDQATDMLVSFFLENEKRVLAGKRIIVDSDINQVSKLLADRNIQLPSDPLARRQVLRNIAREVLAGRKAEVPLASDVPVLPPMEDSRTRAPSPAVQVPRQTRANIQADQHRSIIGREVRTRIGPRIVSLAHEQSTNTSKIQFNYAGKQMMMRVSVDEFPSPGVLSHPENGNPIHGNIQKQNIRIFNEAGEPVGSATWTIYPNSKEYGSGYVYLDNIEIAKGYRGSVRKMCMETRRIFCRGISLDC